MLWLVMWIVLLVVSAGGVIVSAYGVAFARGVDAEMNEASDATRTAQSPPLMPSEAPPVVERYLALAGGDGPPIVRARMQHGGRIRSAPERHG